MLQHYHARIYSRLPSVLFYPNRAWYMRVRVEQNQYDCINYADRYPFVLMLCFILMQLFMSLSICMLKIIKWSCKKNVSKFLAQLFETRHMRSDSCSRLQIDTPKTIQVLLFVVTIHHTYTYINCSLFTSYFTQQPSKLLLSNSAKCIHKVAGLLCPPFTWWFQSIGLSFLS